MLAQTGTASNPETPNIKAYPIGCKINDIFCKKITLLLQRMICGANKGNGCGLRNEVKLIEYWTAKGCLN